MLQYRVWTIAGVVHGPEVDQRESQRLDNSSVRLSACAERIEDATAVNHHEAFLYHHSTELGVHGDGDEARADTGWQTAAVSHHDTVPDVLNGNRRPPCGLATHTGTALCGTAEVDRPVCGIAFDDHYGVVSIQPVRNLFVGCGGRGMRRLLRFRVFWVAAEPMLCAGCQARRDSAWVTVSALNLSGSKSAAWSSPSHSSLSWCSGCSGSLRVSTRSA